MKGISIIFLLLSVTANIFGQTGKSTKETDTFLPPIGIAWGFLYGYPPEAPVAFIPSLNKLKVHSTKVYLFWQQIEPEKGKYNWETVDFLLSQIKPEDKVLVSVFSSSTWATRVSSAMLPPSPAKSQDDYYNFISRLVNHCNGKIKYWQNDSEPNNPVYWSGSVDEFISELRVFNKAVKDADPDAKVVLGGYDGLFNPPGYFQYPGQENSLAFFRKTISEASDCFDVFDIRLYADPYTIPYRVGYFKKILKEEGKDQPVICTEYNGPGFFEFQQNFIYAGIINKWQQTISSGDMASLAQLKNPIAGIYKKRGTLSPQTEMFMMGCDSALNEKYYRMQSREIIMRNILALSSGVKSTMYWDLWHNTSDTFDIMTLMYGKNKLMEMDNQKLISFYPQAKTFAILNQYLDGFTEIERTEPENTPRLFLFKVSFKNSKNIFIAWERRDSFTGEDDPPTFYSIPWISEKASATDLFGKAVSAEVKGGKLTVEISQNPVFIIP